MMENDRSVAKIVIRIAERSTQPSFKDVDSKALRGLSRASFKAFWAYDLVAPKLIGESRCTYSDTSFKPTVVNS